MRIAEGGAVLDSRSNPRGAGGLAPDQFDAVLQQVAGDWLTQSLPILVSGMAGARGRWREMAYLPCPAGVADLATAVASPDDAPHVSIVPGVAVFEDGLLQDVVRGEETQVFGLDAPDDAVIVAPGTHSKWIRTSGGRITGFRTFMTGEFYALLSQHSILARTLDASAPLDEASFLEGVTRSENGHGLLHNAFGARTLALFERMPKQELSSYLSGLLIGEELRTQSLQAVGEVVLIGSSALTQRYTLALRSTGVATRTLGAEATWAGLHALSGFLDTDRTPA
jgi:2-dehydro-3-deoxygalactonokinase